MSAEFVAAMEDVLELYAEPYDPRGPVVCFDDTSTQLLSEARLPITVRPGQPRRQDYEYRREGTRPPQADSWPVNRCGAGGTWLSPND